MVRNSIEAYMRGDLQAAFESIRGVPDTLGEARFFTYRASLLLAVGRVDEASKDIERALGLNPKYSEAFALQAIVAVVQNDKERALDLATQSLPRRSLPFPMRSRRVSTSRERSAALNRPSR
jgi:hypothetical protein